MLDLALCIYVAIVGLYIKVHPFINVIIFVLISVNLCYGWQRTTSQYTIAGFFADLCQSRTVEMLHYVCLNFPQTKKNLVVFRRRVSYVDPSPHLRTISDGQPKYAKESNKEFRREEYAKIRYGLTDIQPIQAALTRY